MSSEKTQKTTSRPGEGAYRPLGHRRLDRQLEASDTAWQSMPEWWRLEHVGAQPLFNVDDEVIGWAENIADDNKRVVWDLGGNSYNYDPRGQAGILVWDTDENMWNNLDALYLQRARMEQSAWRQHLRDIGTSFGLGQTQRIRDASKSEPHGDAGRAKIKSEKQIQKLRDQLQGASKKEQKKIKQKIQNIRRDAERKAKGETHHRR